MMGLPPFLTRTHKKFNAGGDVHPLEYDRKLVCKVNFQFSILT